MAYIHLCTRRFAKQMTSSDSLGHCFNNAEACGFKAVCRIFKVTGGRPDTVKVEGKERAPVIQLTLALILISTTLLLIIH